MYCPQNKFKISYVLTGVTVTRSETGKDKKLITVKQVNNKVVIDEKPLDFFGDLKENYEKYNQDYIGGK